MPSNHVPNIDGTLRKCPETLLHVIHPHKFQVPTYGLLTLFLTPHWGILESSSNNTNGMLLRTVHVFSTLDSFWENPKDWKT